MGRAILMSILFATVLIPASAARDPVGKRGLKRMLLALLLFNALYLALLILVYAPTHQPESFLHPASW